MGCHWPHPSRLKESTTCHPTGPYRGGDAAALRLWHFRANKPCRCARASAFFGAFWGRLSAMPLCRAWHGLCHGQIKQLGRFGVHKVAPKSIMACAKSPGRSAGTRLWFFCLMRGFKRGQRRLQPIKPRQNPLNIAVNRRGLAVKGDGGNGRCRIGADAG